MKVTKKIIAVFLTILTLLSILSTATSVFAAEYVENKARNEYFDSTLSGYLKSIVDVDGAVDIAEREKVEDAVNEAQNSAVSNVRTFSLRSASVQSEASSKTVEEAVEDLDIDHSRLTLELEDGKNVAYLFSEPVSFIDDDGELVYKDTNIKTVTDSAYLNRGYTFENGNNDYKTYFSTDSEKGVLIVLKDGNEIRLVPSGEKSVGNSVKLNNDGEQLDAFSYQNVYGAGTLLRFLPQLNGIKDEIVLDRYNGKSDFEFTLHTGDHTAAINSKGEIEIINSKREIVQTFAVPFAYDAQGNEGDTREHYTDCAYSLEEVSDGIYNLTVNVPEEFLTSEDTVFPVTVDPTTGNVMVTNDSAVYSAEADEGHGANPTACFGKTSTSQYGKGRAMFFFRVPTDIKSYAKITEAKLWLRETTGRTETMYVRPYLNKDAWPSTVTWNTQPAHYSTFTYPGKTGLTLGRRNINSTSTDNASVPYWYAFNITNAVRAWTTGTNNKGLKFIAECEAADGDYLWRAFATKEHSTSAYHPYAVITYTNDTTPPTFSVSGNPTEWTKNNVTLTVSATDEVYGTEGVAAYSFDNGSTWQTSSSKTFSENQTVYIKVKDKAGNISSAKTVKITKIDKTKPAATITFSPTSWTNGNVTATIKMTDNSAIAKYTINGTTTTLDADGSEAIKSKTVTKTFSENSTVTVSVTDAAGNTSTSVSKSFTNIDKTKPSATITLSPTSATNGNVTATIKMTDNAALGSYILDGAAEVSISGTSKTITKTYTDNQTISLTVKDAAGNTATITKVINNIDKTKPAVTITLSPTSWTNGNVTATIKMTDNVSLKSYTLDGASAVSVSETSQTITKVYSAKLPLRVTVIATANNSTTVTKDITNIDKTKPAATITLSPTSWTNGSVTATIKMTDNAALGSYILDGAAEVSISGTSKTITKTYSENQTISLTVKDAAGNSYTTTKPITNIDKIPPSATITLSSDTWTNSVTATIVMADNAALGSYTLDGGSSVAISGTSKIVTKTYTANQTISLTVEDAAGNPCSVAKVISNIDRTLPSAEITLSPTEWTKGNVTATIVMTDNAALKSYKIGNEAIVNINGTSKTITKTYSNNDIITVEVEDEAGNIYTARKSITNIDNAAPTVTVSSETTSVSSKIIVDASDVGSGLHATAYSFNDGEWTSDNYFYVTDNSEVTIKVRDNLGNTYTTIKTPEEKPEITVTAEPTDWTNGDVTVTVSGTGLMEYSFNNSETWQSTNTYIVSENCDINVWAKDKFGQTVFVGTYSITKIDKDAPETIDVNVSAITWTYKPVTVTVTASDSFSGIAGYSFDGGESWQSENSKTFNKEEDEEYPETVVVKVKDNAGNVKEWDEIISLLPVDDITPTAPDIYEQNGLVYISSRSFDFNDETDSPEHIEYKLGANGTWTEYNDEPLEVVRTVDTTIYARVCDEAGNISQEASFILENTLGEYTASYTDIALGEGLFPVPFARTYSSNDGWFFTFEANVQPFTNGYVFTDFYGEKQYYIQNGESKYLSIDEDELTVNRDENETITSFVLSYGGMTCTFDADGRLTNIKTDYLDTDYTWGENSLTIDGGAVITFENGKPKNITVTRTDNQGTSYSKSVGYNWSNSDLMVFTDVMGTSHNYDYTNGLLTSNDGETVTYSAEGRVKLISQSNGAFVKYTYNDTAASANAETPNNIGAVTVSDSKGVTDTWYYADGIYISNTLDGHSDKAVYDPDSISNERTADTVSDVFYIPEVVQEEENSNGDTANEAENPENPENTESENTDGTTSDTPLYEELDENSYAFYTYDEQGRMTAELKVLKASITIDENTTFADAETVAESKTTYEYVSETDDNIKEQISFIKSPNGLVIDDKECYDYKNGKIQSHSKYKYISGVETALYSESYGYNAYGNVVSQSKTIYATSVDAYDVTYTTSYTYDVWGMCTETAVTCGTDTDTTRTEYDALGRAASVTYNDEKVYYTYNAFGSVTAETVKKIVGETEELKSSTTYIYGAETGNLESCTNPDGNTSYYEYDDYGNLKKHNFNGYYFEYNTLGSILTASVDKDPNDSVDSEVLVTYTYIGVDQKPSSVQYANGQTLNYVYDEETGELTAVKQGEETKFSYSQSDNEEVTTLVDNINNLIKVFEDSKVTVKLSDETTTLYSVETLIQDEEVENSFNGTRITVGDRVYSLKSEEDKDIFLSGETEKFTKTYENDYAGNLWKVNTANAVTTEYGYNENSNISTLKNSLNGLAQIYGYGYDGEGNITSETLTVDTTDENGASLTTTKTVSYTYDEYNQLTSADYGDVSYAYVYDNSDDETAEHTHRGNITQKTITVNGAEQTVEYEYDTEWEDKLTSYNGQSITYDAGGNPINYLGNDLTWTMGRQLAEYRDTNGTPEKEDDILYSYTYNEDGIRTSKTVDNVTTTYYLDEANIIEQITGNTVLHFYYDSNNEIIGFTYGENNYFYVKNVQGDITDIVDNCGNVVASYRYDPWGKVLSVTGSNTEIGNLNPFRYRSYYYDVEIGFYYLQSRYYDPEVGRFINCDDVNYIGASGIEISYNAFAYCENDPVINSDPSGLWFETVLDVVSIGWSLYDFIRQPSWLNFGFLVWDIAATCVPFAPGSYTAKGGKLCVTVASKIDDLKKTKSLTTGTYSALRKLFKGVKNVEIHHIIEKRFSKLFKKCASTDLFMSIPLEKELHKTITKRWRKEFKYGYKYSTITYSQMEKAIKNVYFDMPALKKVALDWFKKNWMK